MARVTVEDCVEKIPNRFDLVMLALLVGVEDGLSQQGLTQLMMLNPSDIFRLVNMAGLDSTDVNGVLAVAINASMGQGALFALLLLWVLLPLSVAIAIFRKKKL